MSNRQPPSRRAFLRLALPALAGVALAGHGRAATPLRVRHIGAEADYDPRNNYFVALLALALQQTAGTDGPFVLEPSTVRMPQSRAMAALANGELVDVVWSMTTVAREQQLLPVRIPLMRGLLGWRLLVVRRNDLARFAAVRTLADLRPLLAGQGHDWPDADILEAAGLPVFRNTSYDGLFHMLQLGRYDYFPRGITEAWQELAVPERRDLVVEPTLALHYPAAAYFFVRPGNTALADRLARGLRLAQADGSFERLFRSHPAAGGSIAQARLDRRRVLVLPNPLLPASTPLHRIQSFSPAPAGNTGDMP